MMADSWNTWSNHGGRGGKKLSDTWTAGSKLAPGESLRGCLCAARDGYGLLRTIYESPGTGVWGWIMGCHSGMGKDRRCAVNVQLAAWIAKGLRDGM